MFFVFAQLVWINSKVIPVFFVYFFKYSYLSTVVPNKPKPINRGISCVHCYLSLLCHPFPSLSIAAVSLRRQHSMTSSSPSSSPGSSPGSSPSSPHRLTIEKRGRGTTTVGPQSTAITMRRQNGKSHQRSEVMSLWSWTGYPSQPVKEETTNHAAGGRTENKKIRNKDSLGYLGFCTAPRAFERRSVDRASRPPPSPLPFHSSPLANAAAPFPGAFAQ